MKLLKKSGKLVKHAGRLVKAAAAAVASCICCNPATPPTVTKICGCCFSDQSVVTVSNWPQIESDPDSGYTLEEIFSTKHNAFDGVFAWSAAPKYLERWFAIGETFEDSYGYLFRWYFSVDVTCSDDLIDLVPFARLEEYQLVGYDEAENPIYDWVSLDGAAAHTLDNNAWGTCCGDAWTNVAGLGSPFPPQWYFKLTAGSPTSGTITVSNNKACKCPDGNCIPTADGSDAVCDEATGINDCTAAQDDDCNPFP